MIDEITIYNPASHWRENSFRKVAAKKAKKQRKKTAKSFMKYRQSIKTIKEDAPTNAMGAGSAIAGYSPLLFKHKKFKRARIKLRKFRDVTK